MTLLPLQGCTLRWRHCTYALLESSSSTRLIKTCSVKTSNGGPKIDFQNDSAQRFSSLCAYDNLIEFTYNCRRLTEALLFRDFNLTLRLPEDRLCPPVSKYFLVRPQVVDHVVTVGSEQVSTIFCCGLHTTKKAVRLNYILWIEDILLSTGMALDTPPSTVTGIDVYDTEFVELCFFG